MNNILSHINYEFDLDLKKSEYYKNVKKYF